MTTAADKIAGWHPIDRTWSRDTFEPGIVPLPTSLVGALHCTDEWLNWAGDDWGHLVRHRPRAVCTPSEPEQVAALLRFADEHRITVAARGGAHSLWGQSQALGGIVVDMNGMAQVEDISHNQMTVQAGAAWSRVLDRAVRHRSTPPVLTDYISTSVGGTLSAGGIGGASHRWGLQVDQVSALEVATPSRGLLWCSPHRNADLFDAVRAGHGQVGIITRAVLNLTTAPGWVRWRRLYYSDPATYVADQRRCVTDQRFDYLEGQVRTTEEGWAYMLEGVTYLDGPEDPQADDPLIDDLRHEPARSTTAVTDYIEFADRMGPAEDVERAKGTWLWPHPCATAFVPDSQIETYAEAALKQAGPEDVGLLGVVLWYPINPAASSAPLMQLTDEPIAWLFGLQRTSSPEDQDLLETWHEGNRELIDRAREAGGHAYHVNAMATSAEEWQEHYGPQWPLISAAKETYDPRHILTPGQGMFPTP